MTDRSSTVGSLGAFLRHERERRGVTVEQVVSATKISVKMIHALENDQYADLPAKPFIRGFVVSYCRFLGVPSHEVLTRFSVYLEERAQERPRRDAGHSGYAFEKKESDGGRTGLWILMGSMLIGGTIVVAVFKPSLKHHRKSHVEKLQLATQEALAPVASPVAMSSPQISPELQLSGSAAPSPSVAPSAQPIASLKLVEAHRPEVVVSSPAPTSTPSSVPSVSAVPSVVPSVSPSATPAAPQERRPDPMFSGKDLLKEEIRVKVVVKAKEDVWVKFKVDQKQKNRLVLRQGVILVLFAKDAAALQVSNPAAVEISRSSGAPNRLQLIHGNRSLAEILESKQQVSSDGRTLMTVPQGAESPANPFEGEPVLPAPPPRPQRAAAEPAAPKPELSTP